jgi:adenine deaminase
MGDFSVSGNVVDPLRREIYGATIDVVKGKIAAIKRCAWVDGPYIIPALVDAHIHIESSMLLPSKFSQLAVKHGTVAVVTDPHEVANVAGVEGVRFMMDNAKGAEVRFFFGVPSCVPASTFEKSGAIIDSQETEKLLAEKEFYFLAEMMNYPGVVYGDDEVHRKLRAAQSNNKPIDGHAPGLLGNDLIKYIEAGITTDHECSTIHEAKKKIALGMKILIREGSAAKNFDSLVPLLTAHPKSIMFCTDDCHPDYLIEGHINKMVSRAVKLGYNIFDTLCAASINPIEHYNLPIGMLREGDAADFVVVNNLIDFIPIETYIGGNKVFSLKMNRKRNEANNIDIPEFLFRKTFNTETLSVYASSPRMNVIGAIDDELLTKKIILEGLNPGAEVKINVDDDILKIVLLDRYSEAEPVVAFIKGIGLKKGAMAGSVAHDSHHIIAIGADDISISYALNWVVNSGGGLCYAKNEKVDGLKLPYYGLMCNEDGEEVSEMYKKLNLLVKNGGCNLKAPFMTLAFMALTVIPEIKIFHNGLFDGVDFKPIPLFI